MSDSLGLIMSLALALFRGYKKKFGLFLESSNRCLKLRMLALCSVL